MDAETQYKEELKGLYASLTATRTSESQWPPPYTETVINLAMIMEEKVQRGQIIDDYVRMTITGKFDDILHVKTPIELENIFSGVQKTKRKVVLMEGAPGCGKSTLANHISQQWGEDELFTEFKIVVLVRLRDPIVQKARSVADLMPLSEDITIAQKAEESMRITKYQDVLFIIDGWDELPKNLRENSIFRKLIQEDQAKENGLDNSAVIVTSRPVASGDLQRIVSSRVEILGFKPDQLNKYFHECLGGDSMAVKTLLEQIEENPEVAGTCRLPLNASILVHLFKNNNEKNLPTSLYGVYSKLVCTCISRHLIERTQYYENVSLETLDQLLDIDIIMEPFQFLCKLAYRGVMDNMITFSSLPDDTKTLSILNGVESFIRRDHKVKSYNFIHLSIQEMLGAFYMMKWLSPEEQVAQFNELFHKPRFNAVFQFYSAMTKLQIPGITDIITKVAEQCSQQNPEDDDKNLLVALLYCLHAAHNPWLCEQVLMHLQNGLNLGHITLNPMNCLCIGYFLSCACSISIGTSQFKARIFNCNIGDDGCKYLIKGMQKHLQIMPDHTATTLYLDLKWNNIHEDGSTEISKLLLYNCISGLNLNGNEDLSDQGTLHIAQGLKTNTSLTELQLYTCDLTAKGVGYIAEALKVNNSLKVLNIGGNGIYDDGIECLGRALQLNHGVESLELSSCGMTDRGLQHITVTLKHNEHLKTLKIYNFQNLKQLNEITVNNSDAMKELIDTLKKQGTLESLILPAEFEPSAAVLQKAINKERELNTFPLIEITVKGQELMLKGTSDRVGPVIETESESNETDEVKSKILMPIKATSELSESSVDIRRIEKSLPFIEAEEKAGVLFLHHEVLECDRNGLNHTIPNHDINLTIPDGAVSKGEMIHFELGITMLGPFKFYENSRPISPIVWLCVLEEEYQLMTPFQVALPHYLTRSKFKHHKVQFAKAEHKECIGKDEPIQYSFHPCGSQPVLDNRDRAVLTSKHFCFYCLEKERTHEPENDISYCLAHVKTSPSEVVLLATYFVSTCLQSLEEQFLGHRINYDGIFNFEEDSTPHIVISVDSSEPSHIAMKPRHSTIKASDIDFWNMKNVNLDNMLRLHEKQLYPPRVKISVKMSSSIDLDKIVIIITGGQTENGSDLSMELTFPFLEYDYPVTPTSPAGPRSPSNVMTLSRPNLANLTQITWTNKKGKQETFRLQQSICDKWIEIGDLIGVPPSFIAIWMNKDALECIRNVLRYWLANLGNTYSISWEGLYQLLEDAQLSEFIARLKEAIECNQSQPVQHMSLSAKSPSQRTLSVFSDPTDSASLESASVLEKDDVITSCPQSQDSSTLSFAASSSILDATPTLAELSVLQTSKPKIYIIKQTSPHWRDLGSLMNFDPTGAEIDIIEQKYHGDPKDCCRAMFQHWLKGNGVRPCSWHKLIELLEDIDNGSLAEDIQTALTSRL